MTAIRNDMVDLPRLTVVHWYEFQRATLPPLTIVQDSVFRTVTLSDGNIVCR
jgi:hypothetical protein